MQILIDNNLFYYINSYFNNQLQNFNISLSKDKVVFSFLLNDQLYQFDIDQDDLKNKSFFETMVRIKTLFSKGIQNEI